MCKGESATRSPPSVHLVPVLVKCAASLHVDSSLGGCVQRFCLKGGLPGNSQDEDCQPSMASGKAMNFYHALFYWQMHTLARVTAYSTDSLRAE